MAIHKWDPFKDLVSLNDNLVRIFEVRMNPGSIQDQTNRGAWSPAVDFYAREDALVLRAELPGLAPGDINLEVRDRTLVLSGERRFTRDVKEELYHRIERSYGKFYRSFTLPYEVNPERVEATYRNGVLEVVLPRSAESGSRRIMVEGE